MIDFYKQNKSHIYLRRIHRNQDNFSDENLKKDHQVVYDKP